MIRLRKPKAEPRRCSSLLWMASVGPLLAPGVRTLCRPHLQESRLYDGIGAVTGRLAGLMKDRG